jgi:phenylacetate-CoA ligase
LGTVFDPYRLACASANVQAANRATPQELAYLQQQRLGGLLKAARAGSALYRARLKDLPEGALALSDIVPVRREHLMERFDQWVCDPALSLRALQTWLADPSNIGEPYLGRYLVWESSGTSGSPGIFVQDAQAMAIYDALEALRRRSTSSIWRLWDPLYLSERVAFVGATDGHFASFVTLQRLPQLQPWLASSVRSFSILQPLDRLVASLQAFAPTVLATYPTAAILLAEEVMAGRLQLTLRELWTGGETLGVAARERIERVLGCTVRNSYGASEFLAMGWECGHGHMHINTDWLLLEPVDERLQPVPPGHASHSVLLTNLANTVQPLIRYEMGDQITLHEEPCACGSPLPWIEVMGRRDDILRVRGVQPRSTVALLPLALSTVLEEDAGVFDFQIRQRDDRTLVLRLPEKGEMGKQALQRARAALKGYALRQGAAPLRVVGELGLEVPRGRSGKACRIQAQRAGVGKA